MTDQSAAAIAPNAPVPGEVFGGFRIVRLLGRGGMGAVYEAESIEDGRRVAIKVLAGDLAGPDDRRRFLREGQLAAALNHPNTVYIYGTDEVNGMPTITMELVAGGTLDDKVKERGPLPIGETIEIALQMIDGLAAAYALGILHRDVKPSNCFVGADGTIKVGDFGLSKSVAGGEESKVTRTGVFLGTPAYSAPEQLLGEPLDVRSDIYSVGATVYSLLTGRVPFEAPTAMNTVAAVLQGSPVSAKRHRAEIPDRLASIVAKCLQRKPEERYASYGELRTDLDALREKEVVPAPVLSRVGAFSVDFGIMVLLAGALGVIPIISTITNETSLRSSALDLLLFWVAKGLPESLFGASVGKGLLGLRVERITGERLGWALGAVRAFLIGLTITIGDVISLAFAEPSQTSIALGITIIMVVALLWSMRRHEDSRALHDRLTRSHVVRAVNRVSLMPSTRESPSRFVIDVEGSAERIGPFVLIRPTVFEGRDGSVDLAYDPVLRRSLWIHRRPRGAHLLPAARRDMARVGRLRWVASRRREDENWDAYEAPDGVSLLSIEGQGSSWKTTMRWLRGIADEFSVAQHAGERLDLSPERIWISGDRAIVLDFSVDGSNSEPAQDSRSAGESLQHIARLLMAEKAAWPVLPRAVRTLLDDLPSVNDVSAIVPRIDSLAGVEESVSRRTRGIAMALVVATPVIFSGVLTFDGWLEDRRHPGFGEVEPFVDFLDETLPRGADSSLVERTAQNTRVAAIYVLSHHSRFVTDSNRPAEWRGGTFAWPRVDSVLARHRDFTSTDSVMAAQMVEEQWHGRVPGQGYRSLAVVAAIAGGAGLAATAMWSLLLSLTLGVFVTGRMTGIDVVTRDGMIAGRVRLFLRALLIWMPLFAAVGMAFWSPRVDRVSGSDWQMILMVGSGVMAFVGGTVAVLAILNPQRGIADRLAGTYLVPR